MVELKLDPVDWQRYAADHYMSVRVGECQKLSKISASRTFKFSASAASSSRYGKVEIFRKVGSSVVCLDPRVSEPNVEMSIPLEGSAMQLRVGLSAQEGPAQSPGQLNQVNTARQSKYDQAKEYLDKHHLEVRLSEAMQAVLRERPDDPAAFVAKRLAENGDIVAKSPQAAPASPDPRPAPEPPKAAPVQPDMQASAPPKAAAAAGAPPDVPADAPFAAYYGQNFRDIGSEALEDLSSKFPTRAPKAPDRSPEELLGLTRDTLLQASADGRLLAELERNLPPARSPEEMLGLTRDTLLQASADGRLLAELERNLPPARSPEELLGLTRDTLLQASADGRLLAELERNLPPGEPGAAAGKPEEQLESPAPARSQQAVPLQAPPRAAGNASVLPSASMYGPGFHSTGLRPGIMIL